MRYSTKTNSQIVVSGTRTLSFVGSADGYDLFTDSIRPDRAIGIPVGSLAWLHDPKSAEYEIPNCDVATFALIGSNWIIVPRS